MALRLVNFLVPSVTRCREKLLVRHREQLVDWVVHRYLHTNKFTLRTSTKHPNRVHHQAMDPSRIAICHMRATNKKEDNLKQVEQIVETAKSQQVKVKLPFWLICCCIIPSGLPVRLSSCRNAVILLERIVVKLSNWPNL